jgi:hypothetical protein
MAIAREPIFAALFAKLTASAGYATSSRKLKHWSDVPRDQQPALFLAQGRQSVKTVRGQPSVWTLSAEVYVYVNTSGFSNPGSALNPLMDAIEAALAGNQGENTQTLGGLVDWCRIEGSIETDEGTLGDQAVAIIPISILVS